MKKKFVLNSMGRCGSTIMYDFVYNSYVNYYPNACKQNEFLVNIADISKRSNAETLYEIYKTHDPVVPTEQLENVKFAYQFAHPLNVVLSTFLGRQWDSPRDHISKHLKVNDSWLSTNRWMYEDVLRLEEHFDRWTSSKNNFPILLIKYETMWDNLPMICEYFNLPQEALNKFPKKRERIFNWKTRPENEKKILLNTYGNLIEKIESFRR